MVHPRIRIDLPVLDLRGYPQIQQQAEVERLMEAEELRPFDLSRDPMLRATLLQVSPASGSGAVDGAGEPAPAHILLLTLHHIASDGWSMGVLLRELTTLYAAFSQGQPSPLPPLSLQYADFAVWQRQYLQGERFERQLDYWKSQLAGAPDLLQLPTDRPATATTEFPWGHGCTVDRCRPDAASAQLEPGAQHYALHDPALGISDPHGPLQWSERPRRRFTDCQPQLRAA